MSGHKLVCHQQKDAYRDTLNSLYPVMYVWRQKSRLDAVKVLTWPRLNVLMTCLGLSLDVTASASPWSRLSCLASTLGIGTFHLCYNIIIYNFRPFILFIYVFQTVKTKTSSIYI